jgi:hypothetical protein
MVDGGIWANNPVMNALTDALACFQIERRQVQILSLGCGSEVIRVSDGQMAGGLFQWRKVIDAAMKAQSHNALGQAYLLVGKDNVLRVDAPEDTNPIALDDYERAREKLPAMARSLVEACGREIQRMFLTERVAQYLPCAM